MAGSRKTTSSTRPIRVSELGMGLSVSPKSYEIMRILADMILG